jgi:hypothetical protein
MRVIDRREVENRQLTPETMTANTATTTSRARVLLLKYILVSELGQLQIKVALGGNYARTFALGGLVDLVLRFDVY